MKILIVKTSAIGDVIHTLPALNRLRAVYPTARIDWLVEAAAAEAVIGHQAVDRVLVSGRRHWITQLRQGCFGAAWRGIRHFVRELRATEYDLLIDFQGLLKSGLFVFLARAKRKVGFDRGMEHAEGSWLFLNERLPPVAMDQHALQRELLLLDAIGITGGPVVFDFPVADQHRQEARSLLAERNLDLKRPLVAINPMTTWPSKHWLADRFGQVADQLATMGLSVVFTGGPTDGPGIEAIQAAMRSSAVNLAGQTTLKTLAAIYEQAAVVITTDTGPMHLAAAMGTPVVALFGPTAPWRTGPFGEAHQVLRLDLPCSPCRKRTCEPGHHQCMAGLGVDQVMAATQAVLGGR